MISAFSDLKVNDQQLFNEVVQAAYAEPGSEQWFVMRTWGEIENTAKFVAAHQFEIDAQKLSAQLTSAEWNFVQGLINTPRESHRLARQKIHKANSQRSQRFLEWYLSNNQVMKDIAELQAKVKRRPSQSSMQQDWGNLKQQLFN